jgi:hypothetical protein
MANFHAEMSEMLELIAPILPPAEIERVRFGIDVVASNPTLMRTVAARFRERVVPLLGTERFEINAELIRATVCTNRQLQVDLTKVTPELTSGVSACMRKMLATAEAMR